jgi:hypothetical protein
LLDAEPGLNRADAERDTLAFMSKTPEWKDHPRVAAARCSAGCSTPIIRKRL